MVENLQLVALKFIMLIQFGINIYLYILHSPEHSLYTKHQGYYMIIRPLKSPFMCHLTIIPVNMYITRFYY
jgi:hypothetical protein